MLDTDDTIVAIATARAGSVRGIVRIAGPETASVLSAVLHWVDPDPVADGVGADAMARRVRFANIAACESLCEVPCEVYLWPGQRSYTRQPAAELHTFGSPPILDAIVTSLCGAGARLARPGEFTLRAFLAGRLDLTQAEAVLGVIDADTLAELNVALDQLAGGLLQPLRSLRDQLLNLLAHLEAGLDFVEEDLEFLSANEVDQHLQRAADAVQRLLDQIRVRGEQGGEPRVVLRGWPNVGKSSLFNALVGSDQAIVSPAASTTRDYVQARIRVGERPVLLVDTAGIESVSAEHTIGNMAQRLAEMQSQRATIELFCLDGTRAVTSSERRELESRTTSARMVILTKSDQPQRHDWSGPAIETSSRNRDGLNELLQAIRDKFELVQHSESAVVDSTAARCTDSLRRAAESLTRARHLARSAAGDELVTAELRFALDELGVVVGAVYTDDVLDRIFSQFCIGK